ncbi:MAG: tRNA pseudouridine(38-40) synthase TruA [Acholeplasmatales bacterium]|jgi:tRNA pseudouridine38-40 synthase|nr:tRNA pseudouridine(38-40) synthase TruA [Acholeplasmatales bacterium]
MRYLGFVEYDGTSYSGFQKQENKDTIEYQIERAILLMTMIETKISVAGRTDKGVHALNQAFHFDSTLDLSSEIWTTSLNLRLNNDIRIKRVLKVNSFFHARHSVDYKIYKYVIAKKPSSAFTTRFENYVKDFKVELVKDEIRCLEGTHDYLGYCKKNKLESNTVRTIDKIEIVEDINSYSFYFYGRSFLRHMIRIIMGLIIEVGRGTKDKKLINEVLLTKHKEGYVASSSGLYLVDVIYKEEDIKLNEEIS